MDYWARKDLPRLVIQPSNRRGRIARDLSNIVVSCNYGQVWKVSEGGGEQLATIVGFRTL